MSGFREFVVLFETLDGTTSTNEKRDVLERYLRGAARPDLAWAVFFLTGRRLRRPISGSRLRDWASAHTGLPTWLIEESYHSVGDLAETLAILCARGRSVATGAPLPSLAEFIERDIVPLSGLPDEEQRRVILRWWETLDEPACFIAHKLMTGEFRVGVSATMVAQALARATEKPAAAIAHRLMGEWEPTPAFAARLMGTDDGSVERSRPYPFALATQLDAAPATLGERGDWLAEWKWDGIRAQLIVRGGEVFLWSRGEELVTERFPEIASAAHALPDGTVLDGEIVIMRGDRVQPFSVMQTRIGRKHLTPRLLLGSPAVFLTFDVLEHDGRDVRDRTLVERRETLEHLVRPDATIRSSPVLIEGSWGELTALREGSRARGVEGVMLKRLSSPYRGGRPRGDWWKWKVDPYTMDAVLVYAEPGHGKRAALYTDYTFAVWDGDVLVPVAKAYSGLDNDEISRLDSWIRSHTVDRFGPVRAVEPVHLFELGFEAIQRSTRHKAGIAVRFPRILRWRVDKPVREGNTLGDLHALIALAAEENAARAPAENREAAPSLFDVLNEPRANG
ncbi:MAG: ATP-dependent DNA ligase [Gemmatimonadaceae bacterium]